MTYQNNIELSELTLKPVDGEIEEIGLHDQAYDGGFSLLPNKQPGINQPRMQKRRPGVKRNAFQEFTCS
jgi:hypothetical protein